MWRAREAGSLARTLASSRGARARSGGAKLGRRITINFPTQASSGSHEPWTRFSRMAVEHERPYLELHLPPNRNQLRRILLDDAKVTLVKKINRNWSSTHHLIRVKYRVTRKIRVRDYQDVRCLRNW